ncbi:class I SAM-dependent methyltransferase [Planctomycetota bacterium]
MRGAVEGSKDQVRQFWNRNVCQAGLPGSVRGTKEFFEEAEAIRYRYHYHLRPLFADIRNACGVGGRLLEIGCGMGTDLLQLGRMGLDVTGVDLTESGIELAKRRFGLYGLKADLRVADAEDLPFPDGAFDAVYSFGVLHHTPDTKRSIREVHRVLKPQGRAFVMLYHLLSLNYLAHWITGVPFDGSRKDRCPVEKAYTRSEIRDLFCVFPRVEVRVDYLFGTGWGIAGRLTPRLIHRALGRIIGWHAMIRASRHK